MMPASAAAVRLRPSSISTVKPTMPSSAISARSRRSRAAHLARASAPARRAPSAPAPRSPPRSGTARRRRRGSPRRSPCRTRRWRPVSVMAAISEGGEKAERHRRAALAGQSVRHRVRLSCLCPTAWQARRHLVRRWSNGNCGRRLQLPVSSPCRHVDHNDNRGSAVMAELSPAVINIAVLVAGVLLYALIWYATRRPVAVRQGPGARRAAGLLIPVAALRVDDSTMQALEDGRQAPTARSAGRARGGPTQGRAGPSPSRSSAREVEAPARRDAEAAAERRQTARPSWQRRAARQPKPRAPARAPGPAEPKAASAQVRRARAEAQPPRRHAGSARRRRPACPPSPRPTGTWCRSSTAPTACARTSPSASPTPPTAPAGSSSAARW